MKLEDLEGWNLTIFPDGWNYTERTGRRYLTFEVRDQELGIEFELYDKSTDAVWIHLAAIANVLRLLGWTVLPPGVQPGFEPNDEEG